MAALEIAVVGAGLIGRRHIELIGDARDCRLSGVVEPSPEARSKLAFDAPVFETLDDLLGAQRPDGLIIATPNALHVPQALACVDAGIPALIEKPVAVTVDEGRTLQSADEAAGAMLLVGHHRLHSPIVAKARKVVASGALGQVVTVNANAMVMKPKAYFAAADWRAKPGGGPILINLIHDIATLRALMGEIVTVQAMASNAARGFKVEDTVAITLRFETGALGTILLSDSAATAQSWELTSGENPIYAHCPGEDSLTVVGTAGSLSIPTMRLRTYATGVEPSWTEPFETEIIAVERADPLVRQLEHFCAVIRGAAEPLVTVEDGVRNLAVIEAILEAIRTGAVTALT